MFENIKDFFSKNAKSNKITGIDEAPSNLSPGQPLEPNANVPDDTIYAFNFPMNANQNYETARLSRAERLRYLSKPDLIRICINKRKDQITRFGYKFLLKETGETDTRTEYLTEFFKKPDKEHNWDSWLSSIVEDHLVLDNVVIYPHKNRGGGIYALRVIDPATIFKLVDAQGFTPIDGSPAYQQKVGGLIASNWAFNEIVYSVKNASSNTIQGYSVVESLESTINLYIRKTQHQLDYFTKGNTPSLLIAAPENWKANDIFKWQKMWNEMQKGITKFGMSVMVPSAKVHNTKPEPIKNEHDEWIARNICLGFSLPFTGLSDSVNRATAETAKESSHEEGSVATLDYLTNLINEIIETHFMFNDIEFKFDIKEETDPVELAKIECDYVKAGIRTVNEIRAEHGWEEIEEPVEVETEDPASKVFKKKSLKENINDLKVIKDAQKNLENILNKYFALQKQEVLQYISSMPLNKADDIEEEFDFKQDKSVIKDLVEAIKKYMMVIAIVSYKYTLKYLGKTNIDFESPKPLFHNELGEKLVKPLINLPDSELKIIIKAEEMAIDYSNRRSAELIGKKILKDGSIVNNPNANYVITDTTREEVRGLIKTAMNDGWSNQELASKIEDSYSFSEARSSMIARTETNMADNNISVDTYKVAGVQKKRWLTAHDDKVDPCCTANEAQGAIKLDAKFSSGSIAPPAHPNCRCTILAVLD